MNTSLIEQENAVLRAKIASLNKELDFYKRLHAGQEYELPEEEEDYPATNNSEEELTPDELREQLEKRGALYFSNGKTEGLEKLWAKKMLLYVENGYSESFTCKAWRDDENGCYHVDHDYPLFFPITAEMLANRNIFRFKPIE